MAGAILVGPMFMNQEPPPPPPDQPYCPPCVGGYTEIPNLLPWAIVLTVLSVFCCPTSIFAFILGVIAIVKAASANSKKVSGDLAGGLEDASSARTWIIVGAVLLLVALIINIVWGAAFLRQMEQYQRTVLVLRSGV